MSEPGARDRAVRRRSREAGRTGHRRVRTHHLREMKERGEKWAMLTAYDMYTAATFDEAGIPVLLVGDSASNNVYGNETSLPVTVDELIPLVRAVTRSATRALVVADLPFGSYQASPEQAFHTAVRFMKEAGAHAVKLEGGAEMARRSSCAPGRDPGDGAHRLHPAVRARPRRLRVQGRGEAPRGCSRTPGARGGRGVRRRHGDGARATWRPRSPRRWPSPRSASAPASTATRRSSSGRTWPGCAPAGCRVSSSSTPTCTGCCSGLPRRTPPTSPPAASPARSTPSEPDGLRRRRRAAPGTRRDRDDRQGHDGHRSSREPPAGDDEQRQPHQRQHHAVEQSRHHEGGVPVEERRHGQPADPEERAGLLRSCFTPATGSVLRLASSFHFGSVSQSSLRSSTLSSARPPRRRWRRARAGPGCGSRRGPRPCGGSGRTRTVRRRSSCSLLAARLVVRHDQVAGPRCCGNYTRRVSAVAPAVVSPRRAVPAASRARSTSTGRPRRRLTGRR